jgi:hypothetical protein
MAKRSYRKHGLTQAKTALQRYGARAIDGRTKAGRELAQWTQQLVDDLGGHDQITEMQRTVIELAARTRYLLNGIDAWLIDQPSLISKSKRKLFDVVKERQRLSDAVAGYMAQLGLERRQPKGIDLTAYLESKHDETGSDDD